MENLKIGMRLKNIKDLKGVTGKYGITRDSKYIIDSINDDSIVVEVDNIHLSVFNRQEVDKYFVEYNEIETLVTNFTYKKEFEDVIVLANHKNKEVTVISTKNKFNKTFVGVAKCKPEDDFDLEIGSIIALNKLLIEFIKEENSKY